MGLSTVRPEMTGGKLDTWTPTEAVLLGAKLGSPVVEVAVAEFTILVPSGVRQTTTTVNLNWAEAPAANEGAVHLTEPALPEGGTVQDHPVGAASE